MSLSLGARFGAFEILQPLGAGGMGEVYRARDDKLGREVAIKVLPSAFALDVERVARFKREAQVLASLNHPHIAQIYGLEEAPNVESRIPNPQSLIPAGILFLVMELVDGETLDKRIARGPIPVDEALPIAKQIAEALEAAHEKGIIHRDLKPANIALTKDGQVKVLDFGLAKPIEPAQSASVDLANSPTITSPAMLSGAGVLLGTAAYMAPEQARGRPADQRADIWAFGCVVYEMIAGTPAFASGETVSDAIASVLSAEPDWALLPPTVASQVATLLRRTLDKNLRNRLPHIGVARLELQDAMSGSRSVGPVRPVVQLRRSAILGITAAVAAASLTAAFFGGRHADPSAPVHLQAGLGVGETFTINPFDTDIAISPDGARLAYIAVAGDSRPRIHVRSLGDDEGTALPGTDDPRAPFFSPDGQWIAFAQNATLKKMSVHGGPVMTIGTAVAGGFRGGTWSPNGTILFAMNGGRSGLRRIPAGGGDAVTIASIDESRGDRGYLFPDLLPGGRAVLFTMLGRSGIDAADIAVRDLQTGQQRILIHGGTQARYGEPGYLIYASKQTLNAVPFDARRLEVSGNPVPVATGVVTKPTGAADFALSRSGTLLDMSGDAFIGNEALSWVDRDGHEEPIPVPRRSYAAARLSPDRERIALDVRDQDGDIWIWDVRRETMTRLTFDPMPDQYPLWTPDGRQIVFSSQRTGVFNVFAQPADGTGAAERLLDTPLTLGALAVTPDQRLALVRVIDDTTGRYVLGLLPLRGARSVQPLLAARDSIPNADISADGRWLAYESDESGAAEVYVRPFPDVDRGRWQVSSGGGRQPAWSRNGQELFYRDASGRIVSVPVHAGEIFSAGKPAVVIDRVRSSGQIREYDVTADGRRFLLLGPPAGSPRGGAVTRLNVVLNWTPSLARLTHEEH